MEVAQAVTALPYHLKLRCPQELGERMAFWSSEVGPGESQEHSWAATWGTRRVR